MEKRVWNCKAGSFTGFESSGCYHLRGIRYATSERYAAPVPYVYPEGVHECVEPSPYCVQNESRIEGRLINVWYSKVPQVESCQFLSVTMPDDVTEDSKLPVMVWVDHDHVHAFFEEFHAGVAADVSGPAGDENFHDAVPSSSC